MIQSIDYPTFHIRASLLHKLSDCFMDESLKVKCRDKLFMMQLKRCQGRNDAGGGQPGQAKVQKCTLASQENEAAPGWWVITWDDIHMHGCSCMCACVCIFDSLQCMCVYMNI